MKKIIIFSGTTEGRQLSELLSGEAISHIVCVATDYGKDMMEENSFAKVHVGRMNAEEMRAFLTSEDLGDGCVVVDATHPYAKEVTSNIRDAAEKLNLQYVRVIREKSDLPVEGVSYYADIEECTKALMNKSGNILLTTGSKELSKICSCLDENALKRLYVRVLPAVESLKLCEDAGIDKEHIVAMHGPFSFELNKAIMSQYDIRHLVTKESGAAGGFDEKVKAALMLGAQVHVVERPLEENGVTVSEAFKFLTGKDISKKSEVLKITLAGIGMGSRECETIEVAKAIEDCDAVFGADRIISNIACAKKYPMYLATDIIPVLEKEKFAKAVILFSGDTGFYSGAKKMAYALKNWRDDIEIDILPGISSFSYLASRIGESYDDAYLFSLHGKNSETAFGRLIEKIKNNSKIFTLLSGANDVAKLACKLEKLDITDIEFIVGENLSYENETVTCLSLEEAKKYSAEGIVTAFIRNKYPEKRPLINIKKDQFFIREKVPMTKECIRHESIIRLGLREGDVFYDIGGGTGSVAIEAASLSPDLQVTTIERKIEAVELIKQNIEKACLSNIDVICDDALSALKSLAKPDAVFIGGSGGELKEILEVLMAKGSGIRVVINAVSFETIEEVRSVLKEIPHKAEESTMISVTDVKEVGSYHLMQAQNPVWIFSFVIE